MVTKCEFSVYTVLIFMKCKCEMPKRLTKLYIKPDFPSLADKIAEPRPDVNIIVATCAVSEKPINTSALEDCFFSYQTFQTAEEYKNLSFV